MRFQPNHPIHPAAFFRSQGVDSFGQKTGVAFKQAVSVAFQLRQALRAMPQGAQLPFGRLAGVFEGG
jgi:hypothetical protein